MKKALIAFVAAATLAVSTLSAPTPADARNNSGAVAAGIIGGLAAGAIIGSAVANSNSYPRYAPAPGYVVYESYRQPYPVGCPGGYWARRPIAFDQWGNPVRWSRARFVCP